jgi:RNA polymerase sigma-70 factor (ECF subfamily)
VTPDEDGLARRIARGDASAFDELYDRHAAPLLGYLNGMVGHRPLAEDLLQETMLRVFRHIDRYRGPGAFRAWLYRIATNLALTELRRRRIAPTEALGARLLELPDRGAPPPEARLEADARARSLRCGLDRMAADQRAVFLLRARGLELREIAESLNVPVGTVKSRLHHAVRKLQGFIARCERHPNEEPTHEDVR